MARSEIRVLQGVAAPYTLQAVLVRDATDVDPPDFTTATSAHFEVENIDGEKVQWPATLSEQTASSAKATHTFSADGSDCPRREIRLIRVITVHPSGERVSGEALLQTI